MTITNITIRDTVSTTASGQGGQTLIIGTPTTGSVAPVINTSGTDVFNSFSVEVTGTWTGTLQCEVTCDPSGITWVPYDMIIVGIGTALTTITSNGTFKGNCAGVNSVRLRATAVMTGTAVVNIQISGGSDIIHIDTGGGSGAVSSVSNSDGTLTISPTTGAVVASINLANANTWTGAQIISVASANAFDVGPNGTTNPTLQINTATASAATGIAISSAASGAGVSIGVISPSSNEFLSINSKGTSSIIIQGNATGAISIGPSASDTGSTRLIKGPSASGLTDQNGGIFNIGAAVGSGLGQQGILNLQASIANQGTSGTAAHTLQTILQIGSSQATYPGINGALADFVSRTWIDDFSAANATNGSLSAYSFGTSTFSSLNTGVVITTASTLSLANPPVSGTNTTITNPVTLRISNSNVTSATLTTYGILCNVNSLASGSSTIGNAGNIGIGGTSTGASTGQNVGIYGNASGATLRNYGGAFQSDGANAAPNVGVIGTALNGSTNTAGYFGLLASGASLTTTVIQAENGSSGAPFFLATTSNVSVFDLNSTGLIRIYNGVTTAGWGVPGIVGQANITAQSAAATITSYANPAADGEFEVSAQMNVSAATGISTTLTVTYTDVNNTAQTMILPVIAQAGTFITNGLIITTGTYEAVVVNIRAKASTTITIKTATGTFTGVIYSASGTIKQIG